MLSLSVCPLLGLSNFKSKDWSRNEPNTNVKSAVFWGVIHNTKTIIFTFDYVASVFSINYIKY